MILNRDFLKKKYENLTDVKEMQLDENNFGIIDENTFKGLTNKLTKKN
jgi:hypothetical protein